MRKNRLKDVSFRRSHKRPCPGSDVFAYHVNRTARTFVRADTAALAVLIVKAKLHTGAKLDDGVIRADAIAVIGRTVFGASA